MRESGEWTEREEKEGGGVVGMHQAKNGRKKREREKRFRANRAHQLTGSAPTTFILIVWYCAVVVVVVVMVL